MYGERTTDDVFSTLYCTDTYVFRKRSMTNGLHCRDRLIAPYSTTPMGCAKADPIGVNLRIVEITRKQTQVAESMTGASPVTTILTFCVASPRQSVYSSDRACPCHATRPPAYDYKFSNSYPDAYGSAKADPPVMHKFTSRVLTA